MSKKIVVAVDGPAGSGKSATMKKVAQAVKYEFIDTGLMYRAFTLHALNNGADFSKPDELIGLIPTFNYGVKQGQVFLNQKNVTSLLTSPQVLAKINHITPITQIRQMMVDKQRAMGQNGGTIMVGRDITSIVLPNADLKIYLDASLASRAHRRFKEMQLKDPNISYEDIEAALNQRDQSDKNRKTGPLTIVDDAWYLDNSTLSLEETVDKITTKIRELEKMKR